MRIVADERQLADLNNFGPWWTTCEDEAGRKIGLNSADQPETLWTVKGLHWKVSLLLSVFALRGKRVLELGPLDGVFTVSLCAAGAQVTAIDVRPSCLVKTFARCLAFGFAPHLMLGDARCLPSLPGLDLLFHSGVLYHLHDPISHVFNLAKLGVPVFLDTHIAISERERISHQGYAGHWMGEKGWANELSGAEDRSFWLDKAELRRLCIDAGFEITVLHEDDSHHGGPRVTWLLRPGDGDA